MTDQMPGNLPIDPEPVTGPVPTPSVGRIVRFATGVKSMAAIISEVHEGGIVDLVVFGDHDDPAEIWVGVGYHEHDGPWNAPGRTWHWPPRHG